MFLHEKCIVLENVHCVMCEAHVISNGPHVLFSKHLPRYGRFHTLQFEMFQNYKILVYHMLPLLFGTCDIPAVLL